MANGLPLLRRGHAAATGFRILHLVVLLIFTSLPLSSAFQTVSGSSCADRCREGQIEDDAVCLDAQYRSVEGGRRVESCVSCLLNSTAVDTATNTTDVEWGLYLLRYTLSSCMFGVPEERVSISSPCQVTCAPLNNSIGHRLNDNSDDADPSQDFCTAGQFDDPTINNCAFCYSLIDEQLFTANFLQALHILCRDPPANGDPFFPDGPTIFNETLIAGPAAESDGGGGGGGLRGTGLAVAIALPLVGGIFIIGFGCWGCFIFTRRRRRLMAASGRMSRVQEQQLDSGSMYSPIEGKVMWGENEPPREMSQLTPRMTGAASSMRHPSPGVAQQRWSGHQYPPGTAIGDDGTPLRSSFQRDEVGPGDDQLQDHNLHEQYFGVADGGEGLDMTPRYGQGQQGLGLSGDSTRGSQYRDREDGDVDERGEWVR